MFEFLLGTFYMVAFVLWLWAAISILKSRSHGIRTVVWLLALLMLPIIGPIIYFQFKDRDVFATRSFDPGFEKRRL